MMYFSHPMDKLKKPVNYYVCDINIHKTEQSCEGKYHTIFTNITLKKLILV